MMTTPLVVQAESADEAERLTREQFVEWASYPDERGVAGVTTEIVNVSVVGRMRTLNVEGKHLWQVNVLHQLVR